MYDVIEHVSDPYLCIEKLTKLLSSGGAIYIETVNRDSIKNVENDIHFQLFGLNLLDHHWAKAMYQSYTNSNQYMVTEFYGAEWYMNAARTFMPHLSVQRLYADRESVSLDFADDLKKVMSAFASFAGGFRDRHGSFLDFEVKKEFF